MLFSVLRACCLTTFERTSGGRSSRKAAQAQPVVKERKQSTSQSSVRRAQGVQVSKLVLDEAEEVGR